MGQDDAVYINGIPDVLSVKTNCVAAL